MTVEDFAGWHYWQYRSERESPISASSAIERRGRPDRCWRRKDWREPSERREAPIPGIAGMG
jgi:hypothetical protein